MSIANLRGAAQLVANMLKRDNTPVRVEAAELLLVEVADVEVALTKMKEIISNNNHRIAELEAALNKTRSA